MTPVLLFITGVSAGLIAGFILSRMFGRSRIGDGSSEIRLLEERLLKADQGLTQFSQKLESQSSELRAAQQQAQSPRFATGANWRATSPLSNIRRV